MVSKDGIQLDLSKIEAVKKWSRPTTITEIQSFLGLVGYYYQFVKDFSKIAIPFTQLTRKNVKYQWTNEC